MELESLYSQLLTICRENHISRPYLVGGIPRDMALGMPDGLSDIDLTTNGSDTTRFAITAAYTFDELFRLFPDGHISVYLDEYILDFSSNFISERAVKYIDKNLNIKDVSLYEVYSRDFTINTIHIDLETKEFYDPTEAGLNDLREGIIKTCVPSEITISDDPRRAFRAISFAARLGFKIDEEIISYIKLNKDNFKLDGSLFVKPAAITSIMAKSLDANSDITIKYLLETNLLTLVPMVGAFKDELIKRKMVKHYLDNI